MSERNPRVKDFRITPDVLGIADFYTALQHLKETQFPKKKFREVIELSTPPTADNIYSLKDTFDTGVEFGIEFDGLTWLLIRGYRETSGGLIHVPKENAIHVHTHPRSENEFANPSVEDAIFATTNRPLQMIIVGGLGITEVNPILSFIDLPYSRNFRRLAEHFDKLLYQRGPETRIFPWIQARRKFMQELGASWSFIPWEQETTDYWNNLINTSVKNP